MISYRIIAPLIIPKLKKSLESKDLKQFAFRWDRITGKQIIEIIDEKGPRAVEGVISMNEILSEGFGKKLVSLLDKEYKGWEILIGVIDTQTKKITLIFKDGTNTNIGTRIY
jgi:hypothetical protein